jgi:hypothetical protein
MSVINFAKSATSTVVGVGVTKIVYIIIDSHCVPTNKRGKILLAAGKFGIGLATSAIVCREVEKEFDQYVDTIREIGVTIKVVKTPDTEAPTKPTTTN